MRRMSGVRRHGIRDTGLKEQHKTVKKWKTKMITVKKNAILRLTYGNLKYII